MSGLWARLPAPVRRGIAGLPQSALVSDVSRRLTRGRLRILGFHGVDDLGRFEVLVGEILRRYVPVSADEVAGSLRGGDPLPENAVWFTFDDGLASTFSAGPLLASRGITATAYVCPGVIDRPGRLWFQTFEAAIAAGLVPEAQVASMRARLKAMPDEERRETIARLADRLAGDGPGGQGQTGERVGVDDLRRWVALGHTIGNHTWDHPCLDTCTEQEQEKQIVRAHEALTGWGLATGDFAYPNGNHTARAEQVLRELDYRTGLLFDHRLTRLEHPLRLSRLRIDSDATTRRARSIASGAHSGLLHLATR